MTVLYPVFANRLKELMEQKEYSYNKLHALTGVSKGSLTAYLQGSRAPRAVELEKLALVLGVTMGYLWGAEKPNTSESKLVSENIALRSKLTMITSALRGTLTEAEKQDS